MLGLKKKPKPVECDVLEFVQQDKACRVDRESLVIYGVHLCGFNSRNGGRYTRSAFENAIDLYEGAKCNINHPNRERPNEDRSVGDRLGIFRNVRVCDDGLHGDLHYVKSHPFAEYVCESAERMPELLGFSQNATTIQVPDGQGGVIHESIKRVRSVDLVADPATTNSIFESEENMNDPHTPGVVDAVPPVDAVTPEVTDTTEVKPVDVTVDALFDEYKPKIKDADAEKRKTLWKEFTDKVNKIIGVFSAEEAKSETKTETSETSDTTTTSETTESVKPPKGEQKDATESVKEVLGVLESVGVTPNAFRIGMLLKVPAADRKELAESWPKANAGTDIPKPKSSSVMESLGKQEETAQKPPTFTDEQVSDFSSRLMAGQR
jgi:hypothetical protein